MKTLALIPARGGSKRLPGKNIKILNGKPLIAWSIEFAQQHSGVNHIVVSTDDPKIAEVASNCGVDVPWMRPAALASDTASSVDVARHALEAEAEAGRDHDYLVLLQPTTPFRDPAMLDEALVRCRQGGGRPVIAICPAKTHPYWCFREEGAGLIPYHNNDANISRSQDLPTVYEVSGGLYVIGVPYFLEHMAFITSDMQAVISSGRQYDCDIDDEIDWLVAESVAKLFF